MNRMNEIDVAVVGGGVVGLAAAWKLAARGASVCLIERQSRPGRGMSTHNSGVIHAGLYHPPGSLKATLCVDGRERLYEFCSRHGVPHQRCGKLLVAADESEVPKLESLRARGTANGATLEPDTAAAVGFDRVRVVRHEQHRRPLVAELLQSGVTSLLELRVAHREHFVQDQNVGHPGRGDREAEAREHARGVVPNRRVHELAEPARLDDGRLGLPRFSARAAEEQRIQIDVLESGELVVESHAELEERLHGAAHGHRAARRRQHARDHLQEGALACAVPTDHADALARTDAKGDVAKRPQLFVRQRAAHEVYRVLLERGNPLLGQPVLETDVLQPDDVGRWLAHRYNTRRRLVRSKTKAPTSNATRATPAATPRCVNEGRVPS